MNCPHCGKEISPDPIKVFRKHGAHRDSMSTCRVEQWYVTSEAAFLRLCDDPERVAAGITCHGETAEKGRWYAVVLP
jgi:hypothetical protein